MNYPTQTLAAPLAMTSVEIAELTGKQHAHVLRDIRELVNQLRDDPNMDHTEIPGISIESDVRGYMAKAQLDKEMTLTLLTGYDAKARLRVCLLYTSDAADERSSVDLGGRRLIKNKNNHRQELTSIDVQEKKKQTA